MAKSTSQVDAILERVRRVTQRTAQSLRTELQHIQKVKAAVNTKLDDAAGRILQTLSRLGAGSNGTPAPRPAPQTKSRKRIRRTPEQLKREAGTIVQLIKGAGAEGATGAQIRKRYPKVGPDIKGFVQKFSGRKLKTTGQKSTMRYFVA